MAQQAMLISAGIVLLLLFGSGCLQAMRSSADEHTVSSDGNTVLGDGNSGSFGEGAQAPLDSLREPSADVEQAYRASSEDIKVIADAIDLNGMESFAITEQEFQ